MHTVGIRPRITITSAPAFLKHKECVAEIATEPARIKSHVKLTKGKGDIITGESDWFTNLLTNECLNGIGTTAFATLTPYCHIGSGDGEPAVGNTTMGNFLGSTNTVQTSVTSARPEPPYYGRYRRTFRIAAGTGTGDVTEVGLSDQATDGGLMARALVKTIEGNPAVITKRSDEWLDVTYEFRLLSAYLNDDGTPNDGQGSINFGTTSHDYIIRPSYVNDDAHWDGQNTRALLRKTATFGRYCTIHGGSAVLGPVTGLPTDFYAELQDSFPYIGLQHASYVTDSFERSAGVYIRSWHGNTGTGIGAMSFYSYFGSYQLAFTPVLPKTEAQAFTLGVLFSWGNV